MFLIFGIKRTARRLATVFSLCGHCCSPAAQVVARRSTWFSLFFIPLIPLRFTYLVTCTLCGVSSKVDKAQAMQMVAAAGPHAPSVTPTPAPAPLDLQLPAPPPPPAPPLGP